MNPADENILAEQLAYYRARASEYDEWFQREGRYDHGHEHRRL
jgi:demethylmenaquinone methyltransferase/2-methoxy-6-polyprenyl-1,4-benzoquinol methylase